MPPYNGRPMTDAARDSEAAEVAALFQRLREELAERPQAEAPGRGSQATRGFGFSPHARQEAERYWAVTADRPFLYKPGTWGRVRGLILAPLKIVLRKLMRWYVEPALGQQRDFNSRILKALDELSAVGEQLSVGLDEARAALERVNRSLGEVESSVSQAQSSLNETDERLVRLERRLRRQREPVPTTAAAGVRPRPAEEPDYFAFESRMRGPTPLIRERQAVYVDEFRDAAPVLDIGCGRGEFLTLLRDAGVDARGIDLDPDMVAYCRDEGLAVEQAHAVAYLEGLDDASLGGIFCAHLLEHLDPPALFRLLETAADKLRPSGIFVAETPNPLSLIALANFCSDMSHKAPLHPATLSFLLRQARFRDVSVRFLSEPAEEDRLRLVPLPEGQALGLRETQAVLDADINRLNDVVFGPQDYAVLAHT
jgi:SAM-dependent methyltransferase